MDTVLQTAQARLKQIGQTGVQAKKHKKEEGEDELDTAVLYLGRIPHGFYEEQVTSPTAPPSPNQ